MTIYSTIKTGLQTALLTGLAALCLEANAGETLQVKEGKRKVNIGYASEDDAVNFGGKEFYVLKTPKGKTLNYNKLETSVTQDFYLIPREGSVREIVDGKSTGIQHKTQYALIKVSYSKNDKEVKLSQGKERSRTKFKETITERKTKDGTYVKREKSEKRQERIATIKINGTEFYIFNTENLADSFDPALKQANPITSRVLMPKKDSIAITRTTSLDAGKEKSEIFMSGDMYILAPVAIEDKPEVKKLEETKAIGFEAGPSEKPKKRTIRKQKEEKEEEAKPVDAPAEQPKPE